MAKFKKGDKFIPYKPKEYASKLEWLPEMDKYDGKELVVAGIDYFGNIQAESNGYAYHPDWCEKVEDNHIPDVGKIVGSSEIPNNHESTPKVEEMVYDTKNLGFEIIVNARGEKEMIITDYELFNKGFRKELEKSREIRPSIEKPIPDKLIDWEQRRYELAKEVMLIDVSNCFAKGKFLDIAEAVKYAIICADEMIKQLKKEG